MKNKISKIIYLAACLGMCLTLSVGMLWARTDTSAEKRRLADMPKLYDPEQGFNVDYLPGLGAYMEDHFAYRNRLVAADSAVMSRLFGVSAVDTVVKGTDGWLYYSDSLDDYLGRNTISDREAYSIAHNLKLVERSLGSQGVSVLFTVAPNKNSLYPEHMPYYERPASDENNMTKLTPMLEQEKVRYVDLFEVFRAQDEILYLPQDSHWNRQGATLVSNTILDSLGRDHEDYANVKQIRTKSTVGDLATALYGELAEPEWDMEYDREPAFAYIGEVQDFEAPSVETSAGDKDGSLLMFRDSFGNSLSPFIAEEFGNSLFVRENVYLIDPHRNACNPDTVIMEIVERNVERFGDFSASNQFASGPPVMAAPMVDGETARAVSEVSADSRNEGGRDSGGETSVGSGKLMQVHAAPSELLPQYLLINGTVDESLLETETNLIADVNGILYETYLVSDITGESRTDNGFLLYLPIESVNTEAIHVVIYSETDGVCKQIGETDCQGN